MHKLDGGETGLYYCSTANQAQVLEAVQHPFNELLVSLVEHLTHLQDAHLTAAGCQDSEEWGGSGRSLQVLTIYLATTNPQIPK